MTKHREGCARVFGRYDLTCARCRELMEGMPARKGWGRKAEDARRIADIRAHNCKAAGCGPVCTFGDW